MKKLLTLLCIGIFLFSAKYAKSQVLLYGEAQLAGGVYSINLDSRISQSKLGFKLGFSLHKQNVLYLLFPLEINYVIGKKHGLEIGAGVTSFIDWDGFGSSSDEFQYLPSLTLVYRFQSQGPLNIRLGITSLYEFIDEDIHLHPTLSVGYRFVPK